MSTGPRNKDRDRELSEIIQEAQLVRADVLQRAQRNAKHLQEPLWRLLLREGLLSDDQLFRTLKQYVRVPVLAEEHLENVVVPPELREAVAPRLAQQLGVLPLERSTDGRRAALAMIDPTLDLSPLWPALHKLGVAEVRRFLLNLATLRRGMQMFYGQAWQADATDAALDGPTPPPSRSAITQPIPRAVEEGPSVMVDPQLQAEIAQLSGSMLVPELSSEVVIPVEPPVAEPQTSRSGLPLSLQTTMPGTLSLARLETPMLQRNAKAPSGPSQHTPLHRVASELPSAGVPVPTPTTPLSPMPAIAIEIDLPELRPAAPGSTSQATPLRELSGPRPPASRTSQNPLPSPTAAGEVARALPGSSRSGPGYLLSSAGAAPSAGPSAVSSPSAQSAQGAQSGPGTPSRPPGSAPGRPRPITVPPLLGGRRPLAGPTAARSTTSQPPPPSAQSPLPELTAADLVLDDDRSGLTLNRSALRVPTAPSESGPEVAQDSAHEALITTCEALVAILERQLQTSGPTTLARLCQGVGDRLGFAPRAVRELMLVARLRGVLRAELLARGPLPPVVPTLLGYQSDSPLIDAARELQKVLVDFMRLPQDENEPLGTRIIATAALALELYHSGLTDEALLTELRARAGDTDVVFHVHKALELDPPPPAPPVSAPLTLAPTPAASELAGAAAKLADAASGPEPSAAAPVASATDSAPAASGPAIATAASVPPSAAASPPLPASEPRVPEVQKIQGAPRWPLPPRMPAVKWSTVWVAQLSGEDLLPYQPEV